MPFAEDLSVFFDEADFAVAATLEGVAVRGIFDEPYAEPLSGMVEGSSPTFVCRSADIPSVAHEQTLVIGARSFKVVGVEPDGTGVTLLRLREP